MINNLSFRWLFRNQKDYNTIITCSISFCTAVCICINQIRGNESALWAKLMNTKDKWLNYVRSSWILTSYYPGVANGTKPNQKPIEPNRTQSFDWSSIGSAIEHNWTGILLWVRLSSITEPNRTQSTRLIRFCSVEK